MYDLTALTLCFKLKVFYLMLLMVAVHMTYLKQLQ